MRDLLEQLHALVVLDALAPSSRRRPRRGPRTAAAESTARGSSSVDSTTEIMSSAYVGFGDSGSSSSNAASANGDSGWLSAKFGCRSTVRRIAPVPSPARSPRRRLPSAACGRCRARDGRARADAPRFVVVEHERAHVAEHVATARDDVDEHRARDLHAARSSVSGSASIELAGTTARPTRRSRPAPSCARSCAALLRVVAGLLDRLRGSRSRARAPARRPCRPCRSPRGRRGRRSGGTRGR